MKRTTLYLVMLGITITMLSCKKDKKEDMPPPTPAVTYDDYSQLKVGNYWIYQRFSVDTLGVATPLNVYDSCYVQKDTVINNQTYHKLVKPLYVFADNPCLRDSLHYIVTPGGRIVFSYQDFTTVFGTYYNYDPPSDTICKITCKMADKDLTVSLPAGSFVTSNFKTTYDFYPNWRPFGNTSKVRATNTRYAKNVGMVSETLQIFLGNPNYIERRLVRYHLN